MPVGAEFYTDSGVIQINDQYPVIQLRQKGSLVATIDHPADPTPGVGWSSKYVDVSYSGANPFIALNSSGCYSSVLSTVRSGSNWTFRVLVTSKTTDFSFNYYIFDNPPQTSLGYGLEVRNSAGQIVFSSNYGVSKITHVDPISPLSLTPGRTYAWVHTGYIYKDESTEVNTRGELITTVTITAYGARVVGSTYDAAGVVIFGFVGSGGGTYPNPGGDLGGWGAVSPQIIMDVTGL